ncbi:MAG: thioredoxin domain-containing protein [Candidatus Pacebacteria bacterium]|nr:thioredoxin domain-containing protein [Candidatus Paceibacterota bacterium]MBP9772726.1 thioredoxin domain-containing protein [Candidatus Paceibacterota bacterium]
MTNENTPQNKKNLLTLPSAIVLAGFLIAIAIFASNSSGPKTSTNPDPEQAFLENIINEKNTVEVAPITERDHIIGSPDAKIVIFEYSDTECPFCKRFHGTLQQVVEKYGEDVAWVYRHFPIESLHAKAAKEAEATECAWEQGGNDMFWKYIDEVYRITPSNDGLESKMLYTIAEDIGLDKAAFTECLDTGRYASYVEENRKEGENAGAKGTPYNVLVVKGKTYPVSGALPLDMMEQLIDKLM